MPCRCGVCLGRAGDRVTAARRKGNAEPDGAPTVKLLKAVVHTGVLPTALASRADQDWLTGPRRYMSVLEVCRAFGLEDFSPLTDALRNVKCPTNAVSMAGRGIHAGVAGAIVDWLDARALLPPVPTYSSSCSGVDFFAAAFAQRGPFRYMHASECDAACRAVLAEAWHVDHIYHEAASAAAAEAPETDVHVASPPCVDFSQRRHDRDASVVAEGASRIAEYLRFVLAGRARVAVIENVADADGIAAIATVLADDRAYDWWHGVLDPRRHAGQPVARERAFWIGVRKGTVPFRPT